MGYVILLWHSLILPYNYFGFVYFLHGEMLLESHFIEKVQQMTILGCPWDATIIFVTIIVQTFFSIITWHIKVKLFLEHPCVTRINDSLKYLMDKIAAMPINEKKKTCKNL